MSLLIPRKIDPSVFVVEAIACVQAVIAGRDLGIMHVEIEWDSLMVIKKAQNTRGTNQQ